MQYINDQPESTVESTKANGADQKPSQAAMFQNQLYKKAFNEPTVSSPADVLEVTSFFALAALTSGNI